MNEAKATPTTPPRATSADASRRPSQFVRFFGRLIREKPLGAVSGGVVLVLIVVSIFATQLAPYDINDVNAKNRLQGPSAEHLLGTDHVGRDFFSRVLLGARLSLFVGLSATAINVLVALLVGGVSGYLGGKLDLMMQRFVDAWMAFPGLLLLLTIMSIVGRGLPQVIIVLGVSGGIVGSRVVRGAVIGVKENVYFQAAEAIGTRTGSTLLRHVIPNIAPILVIIFSINIGGVIISEASLSFLGFGLPIEIPSWGGLLSREGRRYMEQAPHLALWPGLCLTITVYAMNNFGDAVRDLLDPRLRGGASTNYGGFRSRRLRTGATADQ
jgi:peptide/nickel transport system permease protein